MGLEQTAPAPFIIPTGNKAKIGKADSYPLGAELLSDALRGTPMFQQLGLSFGHNGSSSKTSAGMTQLPVLSVEYRLEHWISGIVFGPTWSIGVNAVPREIKGLIRANLVEGGLMEVRRWLESHAHVWGSEGTHRLALVWDLKRKEILFEKFVRSEPHVVRKGHAHP